MPHLWYAEKQLRVMLLLGDRIKRGKIKNGAMVIYTEVSDEDEYQSKWDDVIYLGEGEFDRLL
jgi:hypothetical protein